MTTIAFRIVDPIQAQLAALHPRKGYVALSYRKPGGRWQWRTVQATRLEKTVLTLEDAGAELITPD